MSRIVYREYGGSEVVRLAEIDVRRRPTIESLVRVHAAEQPAISARADGTVLRRVTASAYTATT